MSSSAQSRWERTVSVHPAPGTGTVGTVPHRGRRAGGGARRGRPVMTWPACGVLSPVAIGVGAVIATLGTVAGASTGPAATAPPPAEA